MPFADAGSRVVIRLPRAAKAGERHEIEIDYHGAPRFGLVLHAGRTQTYTIFSTSQWMVCVDAPDDRATLQLELRVPAGLGVVASGHRVDQHPAPNGTTVHEWRLDTPAPTYTFGFAAGNFDEVIDEGGATTLRYLGDGFTDDELEVVFADTTAMLEFFEGRAGVPYFGVPYFDDTYTQALVVETIGASR